jgi:hypothetical protein
MYMKQRTRWGSSSDQKRTNRHSGVQQEWGSDLQQKDSRHSYNKKDLFLNGKLELNKIQTLMRRLLLNMRVKSWMTLLDAPLWAPTRCRGRRQRSTLTDSGCPLVSTIPADSDGILMWDQCHWKLYVILFPSI